MQAIILAAGRGSRMGELTRNTPKTLLKVDDETILEHSLDSLPEEINEIIIVVKYLGEKIKKYAGNKYKNIPIVYVDEIDMPGTAGALWSVKDYVRDKFLVINGDDLYSKNDLEKILRQDFAIGLVNRKPLNKYYSCIEMDKSNRIIGWHYPTDEDKAYLVNGVYVLDPKIFNFEPKLNADKEYSLPHTIFSILDKIDVKGVILNYWHSFNKPEDFQTFKQHQLIESILSKYDINDFIDILPVKNGLINQTYLITTKKDKFILQKLNSIYDTGTVEDMNFISNYINTDCKILPRIISTKNGDLSVQNKNDIWRLQDYIEGKVYNIVTNNNIAYESGRLLGIFHHKLRTSDYIFKSKIPIPHQSNKIFERFLKTINKNGEMNFEITQLIGKIKRLPEFFLPDSLTKSITHGDPKISNIIFSESDKAIALIDLDGCNKNVLILEIADALRSWCSLAEDDPNNLFDIKKYKSALEGYLETSEDIIPKEELVLIPQTIKLITLELASKFLRDYYLDQYFDWDQIKYKSRKEHNLARAKSQIVLFESVSDIF